MKALLVNKPPREPELPLLLVEFDGIIHSATSGWHGPEMIVDKPVAGAIDFLRFCLDHFRVAVYSRDRVNAPGGLVAMMRWINEQDHNRPEGEQAISGRLLWPKQKLPAAITIDQEGVYFAGCEPSPQMMDALTWVENIPTAD